MEGLRSYLRPGETVVFLGSSGVGKSTLINALSGEHLQQTGGLRKGDGHGRHTTTARQLIAIAGGALLIDTPGLRQISLWGEEGDLSVAFDDIEQLSARCRFGDCQHRTEPGCAVRQAVQAGQISPSRYDSYRRLRAGEG
jgi:ribosome biogenesis GTPase